MIRIFIQAFAFTSIIVLFIFLTYGAALHLIVEPVVDTIHHQDDKN